jgi:predicted aldo/keto reductase-like oxidoreductase
MRFRMFGKSGLRVSEICLGAMGFGNEWGATAEECARIIKAFSDKGGNFINTANTYQKGHSERILGQALTGDRDRYVSRHQVLDHHLGRGPERRGQPPQEHDALSARFARAVADRLR